MKFKYIYLIFILIMVVFLAINAKRINKVDKTTINNDVIGSSIQEFINCNDKFYEHNTNNLLIIYDFNSCGSCLKNIFSRLNKLDQNNINILGVINDRNHANKFRSINKYNINFEIFNLNDYPLSFSEDILNISEYFILYIDNKGTIKDVFIGNNATTISEIDTFFNKKGLL